MTNSIFDTINETLNTVTIAVPKVANAVQDWRFLTQRPPSVAPVVIEQTAPARANNSTIAGVKIDYKMLAVGALAAFAIFRAIK